MTFNEILQLATEHFSTQIVASNAEAIDPWIEIQPEAWAPFANFLRNDPSLSFEMLHCVTGVDYFEPDEKKAVQVAWKPHIEMIYHLSSLSQRHRLVVKTKLPRWKDDVVGRLPEIAGVSHIWRTADWHERETYDLCGVRFIDHPDMRRILCPDDWVGHPLRKDYVMPDAYHGIRSK